jgi:phosphatidylglycerol---prolipoprotein diacylglyceryl transferase
VHPILFEYGGITLRWYGFFAAIGFLAAYLLLKKRAERIPLKENEAANLMFLLFISGILGARLFYVVWHWKDQGFSQRPIEVFFIHKGGLVFFGGFLMACLALAIWCKVKQLSLAKVADTLAPSLALGHAFGRLGCFMNGCCYGMECKRFWAIQPNAPPEVAGLLLHPTQLYEFAGLLYLAFILIVIERMARYPGQVALSYCMLYALLRFFVEFFRGDVPHTYLGKLTLAQIVCIILFFAAWFTSSRIAYLTAVKRRKKAVAGS